MNRRGNIRAIVPNQRNCDWCGVWGTVNTVLASPLELCHRSPNNKFNHQQFKSGKSTAMDLSHRDQAIAASLVPTFIFVVPDFLIADDPSVLAIFANLAPRRLKRLRDSTRFYYEQRPCPLSVLTAFIRPSCEQALRFLLDEVMERSCGAGYYAFI